MKQLKITTANLKKYFVTKDLNLRNKIVLDNLEFVNYISLQYSEKTGIDIEELNSYGYEGLINAVETFNPSLGYSFFSFAKRCIKNRIISGIEEIRFNHQYIFYEEYSEAIKYVEFKRKLRVHENLDLIDEVINRLIEINYIKDTFLEKNKARMIIEAFVLKKEDADIDIVDNRDYEDIALNNVMGEFVISEVTLNSKYSQMIMLRFGLIDGKEWTYGEIGKLYNFSGEYVRRIIIKELKIIKRIITKKYNKSLVIKK